MKNLHGSRRPHLNIRSLVRLFGEHAIRSTERLYGEGRAISAVLIGIIGTVSARQLRFKDAEDRHRAATFYPSKACCWRQIGGISANRWYNAD
ncbi:MAG TPA: hypothetical protein DD670_14065 [Planctomycetaceae bacterium]|nr:hypothetical protein [Planctomycetaceae bacterium]